MSSHLDTADILESVHALARALPAAQRSAWRYAQAIDLFSGVRDVEAAHPSGRAYVTATKLALIQSEASEALQEVRSKDVDLTAGARRPDDPLSAELADVILRTLELAEDLGVDLGAALLAKAGDTVRRYRHGGVRF